MYHGGEALTTPRFFATVFTATRYARYDVSLQFNKKSRFSGHAMKVIACNFADILSKNGIEGSIYPHNYSKKYIDENVLSDTGVCSKIDSKTTR